MYNITTNIKLLFEILNTVMLIIFFLYYIILYYVHSFLILFKILFG